MMMNDESSATALGRHENTAGALSSNRELSSVVGQNRHVVFGTLWYIANTLLILAVLAACYSLIWEYSTRRYLKGFSDAIVPESSSPREKTEAIINWMAHGPARQDTLLATNSPDRDPTDTLNYSSLLQVCGSATNAFVNLADSAGLPARRLLLLDSRRLTKHVVAEVLIDGRWVVADPAFRTILKTPNGVILTRQDLNDPAVFAAATEMIPGYDPSYTFERTAHVRIARFPILGPAMRNFVDRFVPGWEDSVLVSLLLERESLAAAIITLGLVILLTLFRIALRWYAERRLGIRPVRVRHQVRRALNAFVDTAS
jgi:hypothetical protein